MEIGAMSFTGVLACHVPIQGVVGAAQTPAVRESNSAAASPSAKGILRMALTLLHYDLHRRAVALGVANRNSRRADRNASEGERAVLRTADTRRHKRAVRHDGREHAGIAAFTDGNGLHLADGKRKTGHGKLYRRSRRRRYACA
jgi:hypothetical protein